MTINPLAMVRMAVELFGRGPVDAKIADAITKHLTPDGRDEVADLLRTAADNLEQGDANGAADQIVSLLLRIS